jgi:hypothetical protein
MFASIPWLLEDDPLNPGVRYFALRDLTAVAPDTPALRAARRQVMAAGPVPVILAHQRPDGYWVKPGYLPKYTGSMWSLIFLAQLGADGDHPQIRKACEHLLGGNLCAALIDFGYLGDPRLDAALDWLARSITGEGIAPNTQKEAPVHYLRSANSAPGFVCSANNQLPCAWGAVKALLALGKVPQAQRTPAMRAALATGVDFLLRCDPATAMYPMGYSARPNRSWFKFGFPIAYVTDVLQIVEVLVGLGYGRDPRLQNALELVRSKQDEQGRWKLEYTYNGKTWVEVETQGQPSKWVTLRALRVLQRAAPPTL